ncbi:MAG: ABC transporter ATP-binding protein [Austwickia sp.]|jgi:iron complex transport system ATP-binding protein|nr:ABC transporter ATP-binding protein [Austwickia sp.]MBK8436594.1 ABC transporter ATP-binding protein [Austwickia sp.]MBK9102259.1 ABC transporter ATP-binding protein [Austwickia sp.]
MTGGNVVRGEGVSVGYDGRAVVADLTMTAPAGRCTALLGANGCGKSTLLRSIAGLHPLMAGSWQVGAVHRDPRTASRPLAGAVALVGQSHDTSFPFSALDVVLTGRVRFVGAFRGPAAADADAAARALDRLGILALATRDYTTLSGGERQLVLLARALAQEAAILLLDEPTTYLDLRNQHHVLATLRELCDQDGLTIVATLHDPNQALAYADHAVLLRRRSALEEPSLVAAGRPADMLTADTVAEAYQVGARFIQTERGPALLPWLE